jgi:hypothetical protein
MVTAARLLRRPAAPESEEAMIQHIMLWDYKDEITRELQARYEQELRELVDKVPSLRGLHVGQVVGGRNQSFTHCFVMYFDDMDGLREYSVHPDHEAFSGPFAEACATQVVADVEVDGN